MQHRCLVHPHEKTKSNRGDPALLLNQVRGHLSWRMGLPALLSGNLGCRIVKFRLILHGLWGCHRQSSVWYEYSKVVFCFRHFTAFNYHHFATLPTGTEYIWMFVEYLVVVCLTCWSFRLPCIFITIYGVVCVQLAHFSIGDWKDISIAHVIIIIKSEVSTCPIVIIFFRSCVPEMFVISYSVTYCIYVPAKPGICFHYYCAVYD